MALSYQAETSDGTLKRVILGIDFFDTSDIYVTQGGTPLSTPADYQWDGRTAINLTEVVPAGVLLMVRRRTDNTVTRLKFSQGAPFVRENIDSQNKQFLFLAQEAAEGAFGDLYNNLNMHNFRIFNLAEPTDDGDAATKGWAVRTFSGIYSEYLALCKAEADRAVAAANHAADSERIAKDAASTSTANAIQTGQDAVVSTAARDVAERKAVEAAISAAASEASAVRAENAADAVTGAILDGGPCDLSSGVYPPPLEVKGKKYSTVWAVTVGGTVEGIVYLAGDGLRYTVNGDYYFRVDVTGEVKAQIRAHEEKVNAHPISGVAGLVDALADKADHVEVVEAIKTHEAAKDPHPQYSDFICGEEREFATRAQLAKRADEYHPMDGQLVPRTTDAGLLAAILAGEVPSCSDADWLANPANRGCYTLGDGSTTIRIADLNGKSQGSLGAPFIRGDGKNAANLGIIQGDAIRNITGSWRCDLNGRAWLPGNGSGALGIDSADTQNTFRPDSGFSTVPFPSGISFDASRVVPTAPENRVVNTAKVRSVKR